MSLHNFTRAFVVCLILGSSAFGEEVETWSGGKIHAGKPEKAEEFDVRFIGYRMVLDGKTYEFVLPRRTSSKDTKGMFDALSRISKDTKNNYDVIGVLRSANSDGGKRMILLIQLHGLVAKGGKRTEADKRYSKKTRQSRCDQSNNLQNHFPKKSEASIWRSLSKILATWMTA